ncbi:MAG: methyl-accepting chemotaxis protein, partial [Rhodospirillaceae bacterium]
SKPSREEVKAAESIYARFRKGEARGITISAGRAAKPLPLWRRYWNSVRGRLVVMVAAMLICTAVLGGMGLWMARHNDAVMDTVYKDRIVPAGQLAEISRLMRSNLDLLAQMNAVLERAADPGAARDRISGLSQSARDNAAAITKIWDEYMANRLTPEEAELAKTFATGRKAYVAQGLMPGIAIAENGDAPALAQHLENQVRPLLREAERGNKALMDLQQKIVLDLYKATQATATVDTALTGALMLASMLVALLLGRSVLVAVSKPLARLSGHFETISRAEFTRRIADEAIAEFSPTTRMLQAMKGQLGYGEQEKVEMDRRRAEEYRAQLNGLADSLEERVKSIVAGVGHAAANLAESARTLSRNADATREQSQSVQQQADVVRHNVEAVAAATEELSAAEAEISHQVNNAAETSQNAAKQAAETRRTVTNLSDAAARIGQVVNVITEVAEQTNLLALNATIEAARAGDAGKGFAVVANEVKNLASQTARATEDITRQVQGIQAETAQAVSAISSIAQTIATVSEVSAAVAAAVEEQGAATREISRSVNDAAAGTQAASDSINIVARVAKDTEAQAMEVLSSADELRDTAALLEREVSGFLAEIRV